MATRIFRVNLSEGAPDFQPTATEPGLPMLDHLNANYVILQRWLGDLVAEPEWESETSVNFFLHEEKRGRLTDVVCQPARKADLEGPLKDDLELLKTRMSKVKPESTTEQTLYAIAGRTLKSLTDELELSDHDCFFFKYREEKQPWKLVWCWGYQRADLQPSPAVICHNLECNQLYVHRPKTKALCPGCQKPTVRKKRGGLLASVPGILALLLLLLLGAGAIFALLNPPRLVVTPGEWAGPPGAKVAFSVIDQRYYFFKSDVTRSVVPQSHDESVIAFDAHGAAARAKALGRTNVTFLYKNRLANVPITVGLDNPPDSITVEPAIVKLGVGSTAVVRAMGHYDEGSPIDVTDLVEWQIDDDAVAFAHDGRWEGKAAGKATIAAAYYGLKDEPLEATAGVEVADVAYQSLEVALDPISVAIGQGAEMQIDALDAAGERYSVVGSTWLENTVSPSSNAAIEGEFVVGRAPGETQLDSALRSPDNRISLDASFPFMVIGESMLAANVFSVEPKEKKMFVFQTADLDVVTGSDEPVVATSSDPEIVDVGDGNSLAARKIGTADVTFTQGDKQQVVTVTVVEATFARIRIEPPVASMQVGDQQKVQVFGITEEGEEIELFPGDVDWIKQPTAEHVAFDRDTLTLTALALTPKPMPLSAQFQRAAWDEMTVEVIGGGLAGPTEGWLVHDPIPFHGQQFAVPSVLGGTQFYDPNRGLIFEDPTGASVLPPGAVVTHLDGESILGLPLDEVRGRVAGIARDTPIIYEDVTGLAHPLDLARIIGVAMQRVSLNNVQPSNITDSQFDATINLQLREQAEYRVVDADGAALTEWSMHGPNEAAGFQVSGIARGGAADTYELFVERRQGDTVRSYPIEFALKSEDAGPAPPEPLP